MSPGLHRRAKELYLAALDLAEGEREAWLPRAAAGEVGLEREVRSLLAHRGARTSAFGGLLLQAASLADEALRERFGPGSVVAGRYEIVRRLGSGGMGEVYLARDGELGGEVALKFLPAPLARSPAWIERLAGEARVARRLTHPGLCRVHGLVRSGGESFLTMEYVDGEDLATWLGRNERVPPRRVVAMARELSSALAALHRQGVLHGDLKPGNVIVDRAGGLRVVDFGLATIAGDARSAGCEAGSPSYMAPELLHGGRPSFASDVFSLGLALFELAAGRRAYASPAETVRAAERGAAPPSPGLGGGPVLELAIRRCLDPRPPGRPAATTLEAALEIEDPEAAALALG